MQFSNRQRSIRRSRRRHQAISEELEDRSLLAASNAFAVLAGTVLSPTMTERIPIEIRQQDFQLVRDTASLAFRVIADQSQFDPAPITILDASHQPVAVTRSVADVSGAKDSLVLASLAPGEYTLVVAAEHNTAGRFRVDVSLPGDADGNRGIDSSDLALVRRSFGAIASQAGYESAADADLGGQITSFDLLYVIRNLGQSTALRPLTPLTAAVVPPVTTLADGRTAVSRNTIEIIGSTSPGLTVELDADSDGVFDDGRIISGEDGGYRLTVTDLKILNLLHVRARDSFGQSVRTELEVVADTSPPRVTLFPRDSEAPTNRHEIVKGLVTDDLTGVASLEAQVDEGAFVSVPVNASNGFEFTAGLPLDGSADGRHVIRFRALDRAGNRSVVSESHFALDTRPPVLSLRGPLLNSLVQPGDSLAGVADATGSAGVKIEYGFGASRTFPVFTSQAVEEFARELNLSDLEAGRHVLNIEATDEAGNVARMSLPVMVQIPFATSDFVPGDGSIEVGVTVRPLVHFNAPVDPASVTAESFFATSRGERLSGQTVVSGDGMFAWLFFTHAMPESSMVEMTVDGNKIRSLTGQMLDADQDGLAGGIFQYRFSTVSLSPLLGTSLSGRLVDPGPDQIPHTADDVLAGPDGQLMTEDDVYLLPIAGAKVFLLGREAEAVFTDAEGSFHFDAVPAGNVKVDTDGRSATSPPAGFYFPDMVMDAQMMLGTDNAIMPGMPVMYLPRLRESILSQVDGAVGATLGVGPDGAPELTEEERQYLTIEVAPGSLLDEKGEPLASARIGISTVPPELVRDMLPPGILQHTFDITVQAMGVGVFSTPAPMTFPNLFGAEPGTQLNLLSFDHTTGRLEIEGTATVSADGKSVRTDPGVGIKHPGWHGMTQAGSSAGGGPNGGGGSPPPPPCGPGNPPPDAIPFRNITGKRFYTDDGGSFEMWFGNGAKKSTGSSKCPPNDPSNLKVEFEFDKSIAEKFLTGMPSGPITLGPGEDRQVKVQLKDLLKDIKQIEKDRLYGIKMKITYTSVGSGKMVGNDEVYIYRFLDAADADHKDAVVEMMDTASGGGVDRERKIDTAAYLDPNARPRFQFEKEEDFSASGVTAFHFHPQTTQNDVTAAVRVFDPANQEVGRLTMLGDGVMQEVYIDAPGMMRALQMALDDGDAAISSEIREIIRNHANDILTHAVSRAKTLFNVVPNGIRFVDQPTDNSVNVESVYESLFDNSFADSGGVDDGTLINGGVFGRYGGVRDIIGGEANWSKSERNFRLTEAVNESPVGKVQFHMKNLLKGISEFVFGKYEHIGNQIGKTIAHEVGHTVGLFHTAGNVPFGPTIIFDLNDAMAQGIDPLAEARFKTTLSALKVAVGDKFTETDPGNALNYYKKYFSLGGNFDGPLDGTTVDSSVPTQPNFPDPYLDMIDVVLQDNLFGGVDMGSVLADGAGAVVGSRELLIRNLGAKPLSLIHLSLAGDSSFFITGVEDGATIDPFGERSFTIQFDPIGPGQFAAELQIASNSSAGDLSVSLVGRGQSPTGSLELIVPSSNLGGVRLSDSPRAVAPFATLSNQGAAPLEIQSIRLVDDGLQQFSLSGLPDALTHGGTVQLAAGAELVFGVTVDIAALGLQRAVIEVRSTDPTSPLLRQSVIATGIPDGGPAGSRNRNYVVVESVFDPTQPPLRQRSDEGGVWTFFLPVETAIHYAEFDSASGLIAHGYDVTLSSGQEKRFIAAPDYQASTAGDADGDGLPDDIELAIGTSLSRQDTDNDGIDDYLEIRAETDPLSGLGATAGVIASLPLPGSASDVAVGPDPDDLSRSLAYVATSAGGLYIVDYSDPIRPVTVGGVPLAGLNSDVSVDSFRQIAVVTAGDSGIHLVDVSNPNRPLRQTTIQLAHPASRVETHNGIAYVAAGQTLAAINLSSGQTVNQADLGAAPILDLVRVGDTLFTTDSSHVLRAISIDAGKFTIRDSLTIPSFSLAGRLAVGDGVLYATTVNDSIAAGFATIDISNTDDLRLISDADNVVFSFANTDLAADGSGLLVTVGRQLNQPASLDVIDVSDPSLTDKFVTRHFLPSLPSGVAIGNGWGLVADGVSGLQIVNFRPRDLSSNAPRVTISTAAVDVDPATPGIQILAPQFVSLAANAIDDVQVEYVELLVDGQPVARSLAYPFGFSYQAPSVTVKSTVGLQLRVTDTGGNSSLSALLSLELIPTSPRITGVVPVPRSTSINLDQVKIDFNRPIATPDLMADDFRLFSAGVDKTLGTADDVRVPVSALSFNADRTQSTLRTSTLLPADAYRLVLPAGRFVDSAGNQLDGEYLGQFPTGDGAAGGDAIFDFSVEVPVPHLAGDAFPYSRLRMVGLADNEKLDDRFTLIEGTAFDRRGSTNVVTADVNLDGRPDVVRATFGTVYQLVGTTTQSRTVDTVSVRLQRPDGSYGDPLDYAVGSHPRFLLSTDVNGDGNPDLVTLNVDNAPNSLVSQVPVDLSILLGDGRGSFQPEIRQSTGRMVAVNLFELPRLAAGEFDGDGKTDLALLALNSATAGAGLFNIQSDLWIYSGLGDGTFRIPTIAQPLTSSAFTRRRELFVADVNGDSTADLVTSEQLLISNGQGSFAVSTVPGDAGVRVIGVADFDRDSRNDILTETIRGGLSTNLILLRNDGAGSFTPISSPTAGIQADGMGTAADINGDQRLDWIIPSSSLTISYYLANPDLTFQKYQTLPISSISFTARQFVNVATADVTGDGTPEIITTRLGDEGVIVVEGLGDGRFAAPRNTIPRINGPNTFPVLAGARRLLDIDGDGKLDLAGFGRTSSISSVESFQVFRGKGDGTFENSLGNSSVLSIISFGKVDNDTRIDLVSADVFGNIYLLRGRGDGTFEPRELLVSLGLDAFNDVLRLLEVADVNGDGRNDVVAMTRRGLTVLPGRGDGLFDAAVSTTTSQTIDRSTLYSADFNRDGRADFLVPRADGPHILVGNADSTVTDMGLLGAPSIGADYRATTADFNRDGKTDLALITSANQVGFIGRLLLFLGDGNGIFAAPIRLAVDDYTDVRSGDLNGDGLADIITAGLHEAALYAGDGGGKFASAVRFDLSGPQTGFPTDLLVGDMTSDGLPDLLGYSFLLEQAPPAAQSPLEQSAVLAPIDNREPFKRDPTHSGETTKHDGSLTRENLVDAILTLLSEWTGPRSTISGVGDTQEDQAAVDSAYRYDLNGDDAVDMIDLIELLASVSLDS
ncbi:MAG: FG-GAP-like repeat-containing protein [Pirellulales bacterium]